MNPTNGQHDSEDRLDRIERLLAESVVRNEAAHEEFEREHKRLLTAQIVLNDSMTRVSANMAALEMKMAETTDKLYALIDLVGRHVNEPHPGRSAG